jgi:uncharacterized beta-barrel protein YwiB (DUF1934 family)
MDIESATNIEKAMSIINSLVSLIYDLYPDEEFEELYNVRGKIAQAQEWCDKQTT